MSKQHITVIMGGPSVEYEVSLNSGQKIYEQLDREKYEVEIIHLTRDRRWLVGSDEAEHSLREVVELLHKLKTTVFIAIHGTYGEDGTIQALLEQHDIAYTGSGVSASLLAMDKVTSQELFSAANLTVIPTLVFDKNSCDQALEQINARAIDYPLIVKPARLGSSVGVQIVKDETALQPAIHEALLYDQEAMVQPLIVGREVACGVLEKDGKPVALPPTELIPVISEFFDYKAKYEVGGTKEITPPEMEDALIKQIQQAAVTAHQAVGCRNYSRSDFIVFEGKLFILEVNTLPGMTKTSILPQQANAASISFTELLDTIIRNSKTAV